MENHIGMVIADRLKALGKTQGWLADQLDVSMAAVSKWIKKGQIKRDNLVRLAPILGLSVSELMSGEIPEVALMADSTSASSLSLVYVTKEEMYLLTSYREASTMGREMLTITAEGVPRTNSGRITTNTSGSNKS